MRGHGLHSGVEIRFIAPIQPRMKEIIISPNQTRLLISTRRTTASRTLHEGNNSMTFKSHFAWWVRFHVRHRPTPFKLQYRALLQMNDILSFFYFADKVPCLNAALEPQKGTDQSATSGARSAPTGAPRAWRRWRCDSSSCVNRLEKSEAGPAGRCLLFLCLKLCLVVCCLQRCLQGPLCKIWPRLWRWYLQKLHMLPVNTL